ncbi:hypothetical protein [Streptoalloteichus hindustanus]|uniref:Nucleotidyl transferase AbiEii toxin, Type IV TA system n=1 Tax=Streptoalloteichus hindustanus TaxID=2017 RepID=A0A1M5MZJ8_STRHI|nr:hypothetical protein [Streptoalloteichus hindustanus]SHG82625.1 hypothetical protein SAMN05444320_114109 [Streptoalloteichus hindustanus]
MITTDRLLSAQDDLQAEAEEVSAALGLAALLGEIGDPVRVGSAALGLMVRRDLDVTVVCRKLDAATTTAVAQAGAQLAVRQDVQEVRFRDDTGHWNTDPKYPDGLYLGVRHRTSRHHDWTLDIWFVDEPERQPDLAHLASLPPRLTADARVAILLIKQALAGGAGGPSPVPSYEVYRAVLDDGVRGVDEFEKWLATQHG